MSSLLRIFRRALGDDISSIVSVHIEAFPNFFLTNLGPAFLETMYQAFLSSADCIFLVASVNQEVLGFAVGRPNSSGGDKKLALKFPLKFFISLIPAILRNPIKVLQRISSQLLTEFESLNIPKNAVVLRSICILQKERGSGLASELLNEFELFSRRQGWESIVLTTDAVDNDPAIAFYFKSGYKILQKFEQDSNRQMLLMIKKLT